MMNELHFEKRLQHEGGPESLKSIEDAVALVQSGDRIYIPGNGSTAAPLDAALAHHLKTGANGTIKDVKIIQLLGGKSSIVLAQPDMVDHAQLITSFAGAALRKLVNAGFVGYMPMHLRHWANSFYKEDRAPDIAFVQCAPAQDGAYNLGISTGLDFAAVDATKKAGKKVVVLVNKNMPRVYGKDAQLPAGMVDYVVEGTDFPLNEHPMGKEEANPVLTQIAEHVARYIPSDATCQFGIGAIPDAVVGHLAKDPTKRGLSIWSEMISDGTAAAIQAGVFALGNIKVGFVVGTKALYDFVSENTGIEFIRQSVVNDPIEIAKQHRMRAVNTAMAVGLHGEIYAHEMDGKIVSGPGGQVDFATGAHLGEDGRFIVALKSKRDDGSSRIIVAPERMTLPTTSMFASEIIVTEHGAADLSLCETMDERAEALIRIAAPEHRKKLAEDASVAGILVDYSRCDIPDFVKNGTTAEASPEAA